jgi:ribosomal-protein-alanine N-acetyltransferase
MFELFRPAPQLPMDRRIEGRDVYIRPPAEFDWSGWAQLREVSRDFLVPWEPTWPADGLTRAAFRRRLRHYAEEWQAGAGYAFFIFARADDGLRGGITLSNVRRGVAQAGTLGYWVGAPFARQGVMSDAIRCVIAFAFDDLRLHRLEAACLPRNEASKCVLAKAGFREEGFAPKYLKINGRWEDHLLFALLEEQAAALRAREGLGGRLSVPRGAAVGDR